MIAEPPRPRRRSTQSAAPDLEFDVAIIGGGVVGCATARSFALRGASVILIEKSTDILSGASKGNSALLHTGFDAPPGSLELQLVQRGYHEYLRIHKRLNLPLLETGAMVVAWSPEEFARLQDIAVQAVRNGVTDTRLLCAREARRREPALAADVHGALLVPGEHVIDPWSAPLAYLTQACAHGAHVLLRAELLNGNYDGIRWHLATTRGAVAATDVINCGGLYGDVVDQRCLGSSSFEIRPRKGQFVVFDKPAAKLLTTTILPVPTDRTKGVVLARTVFGNVLVGPTAEDQPSRERADIEKSILESLIATAVRMLPALAGVGVNAAYAGLRTASECKEYRIQWRPDRRWLTLGGIRSTGLTAALGLAEYAADLIGERPWSLRAAPATIWTPVPNIAEHLRRDWQTPGYGEIVCHCEMVTRREIEQTFSSPIPPGDLGGLRRRTRAGMGRCQMFYCGDRIAALSMDRLATGLANPNQDD